MLVLLLTGCSIYDALTPFTKNVPPPRVPTGVTAHRDLVFAERPERDLHLDVYVPDDAPRPVPLMIYVFGGGYYMGSRHAVGLEPPIWGLLDEGFAVATLDYRYSTEALFPAQIHDVTAGVCWLRAHASDFGVDSDHVAMAGHSAGAHLSSLTALGADDPELLDASCGVGDAEVHALVDFFGPTDFAEVGPDDSLLFSKIEDLFGGPLDEAPELVALSSVLDRVDAADPPALIFHGDADDIVPYAQSVMLQEAFEAIGHDSELVTIEGGKHGPFRDAEVQQAVSDFLGDNLDAP